MSAWSTNKLGKTFSWSWDWTKRKLKRNVLQLSGGQQQAGGHCACARSEAPVILADEPTGNLDEQTAGDIIAILKKLAKERQKMCHCRHPQ